MNRAAVCCQWWLCPRGQGGLISLAPFATLLFARAWTSFPLQFPELTKRFSQPFDVGTLLRSHLTVTPSAIPPRTPGFSPPRGVVTKSCLLTFR